MMKYLKVILVFLFVIPTINSFAEENNSKLTYEKRYSELKYDLTNFQPNVYSGNSTMDIYGLKKTKRTNELTDELIGIIAFNAATVTAIGLGYATGGIDEFPIILVGFDVVISGMLAWKMFGGPFK